MIKQKKQQGIVLFVVLISVALLTVLAANFVIITSRSSLTVDSFSYNKQAKYSAYSGIQYAIYAMRDPDKETRWETDGRIYQVHLDDASIYIKIMPENGLIDINRSSEAMLTQLFVGIGLDETSAENLAANIKFWRSPSRIEVVGAQTDDDYTAAGMSVPGHRKFYTIEEIGQVLGMTAEIYTIIKPMITVNGRSKVSAYYASREVMQVLGLSDAEIDEIEQARINYYDTDESIDSSLVSTNNFLNTSKTGNFYRILSHAEQSDGSFDSQYATIRKRIEDNGGYREVGRGRLEGELLQEFLSQIQSIGQISE